MIETITFLGSPATVGAKVWRPDGATDYSSAAGPFVVRRIGVADLEAVAELVGNCPINAFVVRGDPSPVDATQIPYRRHKGRDGEPATLVARAHSWLAIDIDEQGGTEPRADLKRAAMEARAKLPRPFAGVRAFAMATSSAGIKPGVRVRLWFWCSRPVSDREAELWLAGHADTQIYHPSQPCYCAKPRFEGRPDPFEHLPRSCWLDGEREVQVPDQFAAPLADFGAKVAGAVPGNRNVDLTSLAGSMRRRGLGEDAIRAALSAHNAALAAPLPQAEIESIARSVSRYTPEAPTVSADGTVAGPPATVKATAKAEKALARVCTRIADDPGHWKDHCVALGPFLHALPGDLARVRVERALAEGGVAALAAEVETVLAALRQPALDASAAKLHAWAEHAIVNEEGGLVPCAENLSLLLRNHEDFALWHNSRSGRPVWDRCPWREPGSAVIDGDDFQMRCWLSRVLGWFKMPCDLPPAFAEVATARRYDPWKGFLEALQWDGQRRLGSAAARLLGAAPIDAHNITFAWWLVSAVARTFVPGCQADYMLVLEGAQGEGKTTFLRELAMHEAFFTRIGASQDLANVRTIGKIHGPVIIEIAELDVIRKSTVEAVKVFVDERIDRVQWLYARTPVDVKRTCVFAGTSNDREYLRDVTGNRRFWPIECGKIDVAALREEREQLWAEAVALFRAGCRWWPTKDEVAALGLVEIQESRRVVSAAEDRISAVLDAAHVPGKNQLTGHEMYAEQFDPKTPGRLLWITTAQCCTLTGARDYEAQQALRALGWMPQRIRLLTGARIRGYVRP